MLFRQRREEIPVLVRREPGLEAHCRRVATLATEIANALPLPSRTVALLERAALLHHDAALLFDDAGMNRLLRGVLPKGNWTDKSPQRGRSLPEELVALVTAFRAFPQLYPDRSVHTAAEILAIANFLDEHIEFSAWDYNTLANLSEFIDDLGGLIQSPVRDALRKAFRPWRFTLDTGRLPVQIGAIQQILGILAENDDGRIDLLAGPISRDPVIAASMIRAANSALYGRRGTVRTVPQAIAHLGTEITRRLLMALAVRPIFASASLKEIWKHSLGMAEFIEAFARSRQILDPEEALFIGLVHDIGRLATQAVPQTVAATFARLSEGGCPVTYIEQLLFGSDHAELGAAILSLFQVPEEIVEAVRFHHRPAASDSVLASVLYLGEYAAGTEEDLPSTPHIRAALAKTQCSFETLTELARTSGSSLSAMLSAA